MNFDGLNIQTHDSSEDHTRYAQTVSFLPGITVIVGAKNPDDLSKAVAAMMNGRPPVVEPSPDPAVLQRYRPIASYDCGDVEEDDYGNYVDYDDLRARLLRLLGVNPESL